MKLLLYRAHVVIGSLVLLLTLARLVWKFIDNKVSPTPGLTGWHLLGAKAIHVFLYVLLLAIVVTGIVLNIQSGLIDVLLGGSDGDLPHFDQFRSRTAHGLLAKIFIGLLVAHIGGVLLHQKKHGHVLSRMGIGQ